MPNTLTERQKKNRRNKLSRQRRWAKGVTQSMRALSIGGFLLKG